MCYLRLEQILITVSKIKNYNTEDKECCYFQMSILRALATQEVLHLLCFSIFLKGLEGQYLQKVMKNSQPGTSRELK